MDWLELSRDLGPVLVGLAGVGATWRIANRQLDSQATEYERRRSDQFADEQRGRLPGSYDELHRAVVELLSWADVQIGPNMSPVHRYDDDVEAPGQPPYTYGDLPPALPEVSIHWTDEVEALRNRLQTEAKQLAHFALLYSQLQFSRADMQNDDQRRGVTAHRYRVCEALGDHAIELKRQMRSELHGAPVSGEVGSRTVRSRFRIWPRATTPDGQQAP